MRLVEAIPSAGALRFEMLTPGTKGHFSTLKAGGGKMLREKRGRPSGGGFKRRRR